MTAPRRYLFVGTFVGFAGGIERFAYAWAKRLASEGHVVEYAGSEPSRDAEAFRSAFAAVHTSIPEGEYDEVVLHKIPSLSALRSLKRRFGGKLVFFAHDHDLYCPRHHYYTPFGRTNCHRAYSPLRCILCSLATHPRNWADVLFRADGAKLRLLRWGRAYVISAFMRENLVKNGFRPENVTLVPPEVPAAVPLTAFTPGLRPIRLLFCGQLIAGKGCDLFMDVLDCLKVPYYATIAGDGKDRAQLEARAVSAMMNVVFTGWVEDPAACFRGADLTLFTSRWQEPYGLVGAESIACGTPVIAFDVGGVREWLKPGVNGRLVREGDVEGMARCVERYAAEGRLDDEAAGRL